MGRFNLRYAHDVDARKYRETYPPTEEDEEYLLKALKSAWGLMEDFKHIEQGLARCIITALGLNTSDDPPKWKAVKYQLGKLFSFAEQIDMVEKLIELDCLKLSDNNMSELPTGFSKTELPYFRACRLAMEYRNELAHTGFIIFVQNNGTGYIHHTVVGADNPRTQNPHDIFRSVAICERSQIDPITMKRVHFAFGDWVFAVANRLPIYLGEPIVEPTGKTIDSEIFFNERKPKIASQLEKLKVSKVKRLDSFINSLKVDETEE